MSRAFAHCRITFRCRSSDLACYEGIVRRDSKISGVSSLLGHPVVAMALGALLGAALTFVSERAASFVTPQDPLRGFAIVVGLTAARLAVAGVALASYSFFVPAGLVPFGFALGVSFIAGLVVEAVRVSLRNALHTSA